MKNVLVVLIILAWLGLLYFGYITVVGKSLKSKNPPPENKQSYGDFRADQAERIRNLKEQQQRLLDMRRDRMQMQRF